MAYYSAITRDCLDRAAFYGATEKAGVEMNDVADIPNDLSIFAMYTYSVYFMFLCVINWLIDTAVWGTRLLNYFYFAAFVLLASFYFIDFVRFIVCLSKSGSIFNE